MDSKNLIHWKHNREYSDHNGHKFQRKMQINGNLISRLGLEVELEGHSGCVNCLEWNQSGSLLASGSDDVQIIVWDPLRYKKLHCLQSGHQGNIFSIKFMPKSNDNIVCSGAADCKVRVHDMKASETILACDCHMGRVKRLAVAPDVPHIFWSAAEDGLVLQYDLREKHRCFSVCNNVLINLMNYNGPNAEVKCVAINPIRTELIAIGANDAFVRLYDRRMISLQSIHNRNELGSRYSWERRMAPANNDNISEESSTLTDNLPIGCVKYFIAGHLLRRKDKKRYRAYASTYLSFSPDGNELLSNLGSEQIYLFDVIKPSKPKFYNTDVMHKNGYHKELAVNTTTTTTSNGYHHLNGVVKDCESLDVIPKSAMFDKKLYLFNSTLPPIIDKIKTKANERFDRSNYTLAIDLYNKAVSLCPRAAVLYGNRALAYMNRKWDGDIYAALRDCYTALQLDGNYYKANYRLCKCLLALEWFREANDCYDTYKQKFAEQADTDASQKLYREIQQAVNNKSSDQSSTCRSRSSPYTETDSNGSNDDVIYNMSNAVNSQEREWRSLSFDYKSRYCGHCNTTTDIKEANFFGSDGQYIIAGSDDGSFFVWDRQTTNIVRVMRGDESIVNCLQPHPTTCLLATSGIDQVVRLWSPRPEDGRKDEREVENSGDAAMANQKRMNTDPLEVMLANMGYRVPTMLDSEDEDSDQIGVHCRTS
ncbi:WD and tetratricopeptide repeats protein 1-like [Oppia nitens]|uniref:WD and tetratricopeptide repeats protein 1-like n=1 Tax=Oppia nitens TaxID=1686743 RepID=UPI0023DA2A80|nr:WD and tetratricopeptide repeats protein 1-like [Oppia nitens]